MRFLLALLGTLTLAVTLHAQPLPALVAPTDALSPADERKALVVPAGFEVQLVASEPDIQKPMQMAFDAKGRLWVTTSYHYPFPAEKGKGTDKLFILSDFGPDGKARKVQTFAADLNIPIGILPLPDCNSCIVSSIGEILKLTDTDGDGKYDKKEVLFTGLGYRDTHGMYNSYTLMPDGWVYACHGFSNESKTKGKDGHEVQMRSGNMFRFRPDGSRIEVVSRGQVNPFGMTIDPWFNLYTADCHSKPMTQNIPGATYESFNSTSDPLGFGPVMFGYDPGGTGLCGLSWYDADQFPANYKGMMFLGNVVTSRVNMAKIEWTGSTPKAVQQPDFIASKDPWFRPVDIKLGPDGAIYISDFYNKIIGHYEVDLKHPGRDKDRGRIWRVAWKGNVDTPALEKPRADFTKATDTELVKDFVSPNMTVRMLAGNEFLHRVRAGKKPKPEDDTVFALLAKADTASVIAGWLSFAAEAEGESPNYGDLVGYAKSMEMKPDQFSTLMLRAMGSKEKWGDKERATALEILKFDAPRLTRATVDAMATHPHADFVKPLIEIIQKCPAGDTHLKHAARIALRNQFQIAPGNWDKFDDLKKVSDADAAVLLDICFALPNLYSTSFLVNLIKANRLPEERWLPAAEHIGRYGGNAERVSLVHGILKRPAAPGQVLALLHAFVRGTQTGGEKIREEQLDDILILLGKNFNDPSTTIRIAALKLLADLPPTFPVGFTFRGKQNVDPLPVLTKFIGNARELEVVRTTALETLVRLDANLGFTTAENLIDDIQTPPVLRERAALILAASTDRNHKIAAKDAIKSVPYRSAVVIATALAGSNVGGELLLEAVKQGKAPARLLQEKAILDRLRASEVPDLDKQVAALTKGLQPTDQKIAELLKTRAAKLPAAKADKELGAKLYEKHCGACHQIAGKGGKVGPNLDGIGARGPERLLEDILDPNRNVDAAFRARVLQLKDGTSKSGLMLRVEGEVVVMADDQGKEYRVATKDIDVNRETCSTSG
jgi:putative heme-binding domain-containing protein